MLWNALFFVLLIAVCVFAWKQGGRAERAGAALMSTVALLSTIGWVVITRLHLPVEEHAPVINMLVGDGVLSIGFLVLALRYTSLWIGAALLIQGAEFAVNATYFGDSGTSLALYAARETAVSFVVLGTLATGTEAVRRRRRRRLTDGTGDVGTQPVFGPPPLPPGAPS